MSRKASACYSVIAVEHPLEIVDVLYRLWAELNAQFFSGGPPADQRQDVDRVEIGRSELNAREKLMQIDQIQAIFAHFIVELWRNQPRRH